MEATESQLPLRWPADRPGTVETVAPLTDGVANAVLDDGSIVGTSVGPGGPPSYAGWVRRPDGEHPLAQRARQAPRLGGHGPG